MPHKFKNSVAVLIVLTAAPALAADFNNHVEVGVFSLVVGNFNARYERNLNDFVGLFGGAGFAPMGYIFVDFNRDDIAWKYGNVNVGAKLFPLGGFRALYIQGEANVNFHHLEDKSTGATASVTNVVPAMLIGWRWVIAKRATITLGGGSGYASADINVGDEHIAFQGIRPRVDLNLGFLF